MPSCPRNSHYKECGPRCEKTCEETACDGDDAPRAGCFCNEGMVSNLANKFNDITSTLIF